MARILSLEFDPIIAETLQMILSSKGYDAIATSNVHEALLILRTQSIDVLTLGLGGRAPMNGDEFLRLLKDEPNLCDIPVILLTGFPRSACIRFLKEFELDIEKDTAGFVMKGSDTTNKELFSAIETILKKI